MKHIQLKTLGTYGELQYVDNETAFGTIQPDSFSIYTEGYTNRPIPLFNDNFVLQFMNRAEELGIRNNFV